MKKVTKVVFPVAGLGPCFLPVGSKLGYLEATIDFGLRHPEVGADFARLLARRAATIQ